MFGLGWGELLIILLIVLAIFGTSRIAGIGGALGGSIREFKKAVHDDETTTTTVTKVETTAPVTPVVPRVEAPERTEQKI